MIDQALDILAGYHSVRETLKAGRRQVISIWVDPRKFRKEDPRLIPILALAAEIGIPVRPIPAHELQRKTATKQHQGIAAKVTPYPLVTLESLLAESNRQARPAFLLIIDGVEDPRNLGAMVRTALAVGVTGVVIPKNRSAGPTPTVSRTSAGALEHIRLARVTNMVRAVQWIKAQRLWVYGLAATATQEVYAVNLTDSLALVVGGEEKGVRTLMQRHCDLMVSIPQHGAVASLNASVAGAVAMYEVLRQQRGYGAHNGKE